jgi:hypothetical protein
MEDNRDLFGRILAAKTAGVEDTTITSTLIRTSSLARLGSRSSSPSAYRYSMAMFCPSKYPRSRKPCWNASTCVQRTWALDCRRTPTLGTLPGCWASARWTEARTRVTSNTTVFLVTIPPLFTAVHRRLSRTFFLAPQPKTPLMCQFNGAECQDELCLRDYFA